MEISFFQLTYYLLPLGWLMTALIWGMMMVFFKPGDIVKFKAIDRQQYDEAIKQVEQGTFNLQIKPVVFDLHAFLKSPQQYNQQLLGATS